MLCDEEERDEVCYYCRGVISLEIFPQKLAGSGTLNSDRLESCVPLVPSTIRRYLQCTNLHAGRILCILSFLLWLNRMIGNELFSR